MSALTFSFFTTVGFGVVIPAGPPSTPAFIRPPCVDVFALASTLAIPFKRPSFELTLARASPRGLGGFAVAENFWGSTFSFSFSVSLAASSRLEKTAGRSAAASASDVGADLLDLEYFE